MGIFADYGPKYFEAGYNVIPVNGKAPISSNFQRWSKQRMTDAEFEELASKHGDCNIGLVCGFDNIVCLDPDFTGDQSDFLLKAALEFLPPIVSGKKGKKNYSIFYRSSVPAFKILEGKQAIFELLNVGNMTVLPPSIHPDTFNKYEWIASPLTDITAKDLPELTADHARKLKQLKHQFFNNIKEKVDGRNNFLGLYAFAIIEKCNDLSELTACLIKKDEDEFLSSSYYNDRHENKAQPAKSFAEKHAERLYKSHKKYRLEKDGVHWDFGFKAVDSEFEIYTQVFDETFKDSRKCIFEKTVFADTKNYKNVVVENNIDLLKADCMIKKLKPDKVIPYLYKWIDEIPSQILLDIKSEDNGAVEEILSYVKVSNYETICFIEMMKEWMANIWRKFENPRFQNFCPILLGAQGVGKSELVNNILEGFGKYYSSNFTIEGSEKDLYMNIVNKLVLNIAEFDRTAKMNIAQIKNILTADSAFFRVPYGRKPESHKLHGSFISSANRSDILVDSTGNRRFLIAKVESINFNYPKNIGAKILANSRFLFESGFKMPTSVFEKIRASTDEYAPESDADLEQDILAIWESSFNVGFSAGRTKFNSVEVVQIISKIALEHDKPTRYIKHVLKKNGYYLHTELARYWLSKKRALSLVDDNLLKN